MQNSVNHAPGLKCKVCSRLLSEVMERLASAAGPAVENRRPHPSDLHKHANTRVVRLTTRGRKSGQLRTVTVWFVVAGPARLYVQHSSHTLAQWYRNLLRDPTVTVDFGDGPVPGRATSVTDREIIQDVLRRIRRKYVFAWLFQLLGRHRQAVVAEITIDSNEC